MGNTQQGTEADRAEPFGTDDLSGILWQVWTAYLGVDPHTTGPATVPDDQFDVIASIAVAGAWQGHVTLRCCYPTAVGMAAAMLELDNTQTRPEDVADAAGELINIVAGNVKSLLPQPTWVALPQVVRGHAEVLWPGTQSVCRVQAQFADEPVVVGVLHLDRTSR